jgi:phospholipase/lecithinase/hemolysin
MKLSRRAGLAAVLLSLLAACGGGDGPDAPAPSGAPTTPGDFAALVSFGDSLSDLGTYRPATSVSGDGQPPYVGGQFSTNGAANTIFVQNLATALGLVVTPGEVGFNGQSVPCPAALQDPALAPTCTGYGQGGARVTSPAGIGRNPDGSGALTVPVKTQIARHLARFGAFRASDLVLVFAGHNDVLVQFGAFAAQATAIRQQEAAGRITPQQAQAQLLAAQVTAENAVRQAALDLTGYVRSDVLGHGARYVAVLALLDLSVTPFGRSLPEDARGVLKGLVSTFNDALPEGLDGAPVRIMDVGATLRAALADPAAAGFSNVTVPACDAQKIAVITGGRVTDGSSLFCNADPLPYNGLRAGADIRTWLFADSVHPTTGGHKALGDFVLAQLRGYGWVR